MYLSDMAGFHIVRSSKLKLKYSVLYKPDAAYLLSVTP